MKFLLFNLILLLFIHYISCSHGDRSQYFINCVKSCGQANCTKDDGELTYIDTSVQPIFNQILLWSCRDECQYECMWKTTGLFLERKWAVPQFFGKWPFIRFFGIQEPASVFFSILNLLTNYRMLKRFRREIRKDTPLYYVWNMYSLIAMNGWLWSIVFHTRDFEITEVLDYTFAYSIVLSMLYCAAMRCCHKKSIILKVVISLVTIFYFLNHFAYLSLGQFDYEYNMRANVITGIMSTVVWIAWYLYYRKRLAYAWKIVLFTCLAGLSLVLELNDFAPIFWIFDAHALWHLSTVPLTYLFYNFIISDSKYLRVEKYKQLDENGDHRDHGDDKKFF